MDAWIYVTFYQKLIFLHEGAHMQVEWKIDRPGRITSASAEVTNHNVIHPNPRIGRS